MGYPHEMRPDRPVTDVAFHILKNRGNAIHFKELITEVMRVKAINLENPGRLIAQMHTEINLDSRFLHKGNGEWGLREWLPKGSKVIKIRPEASAPVRSRSLLRNEDDADEEEEPEDEDSDDRYSSDEEEDDEEEE